MWEESAVKVRHLCPKIEDQMSHTDSCTADDEAGVGAVIPTLLRYPCSVVCMDVEGENFHVTHR